MRCFGWWIIEGKFDRVIIEDCRALYGDLLKSYYVIPDKFLTKIN